VPPTLRQHPWRRPLRLPSLLRRLRSLRWRPLLPPNHPRRPPHPRRQHRLRSSSCRSPLRMRRLSRPRPSGLMNVPTSRGGSTLSRSIIHRPLMVRGSWRAFVVLSRLGVGAPLRCHWRRQREAPRRSKCGRLRRGSPQPSECDRARPSGAFLRAQGMALQEHRALFEARRSKRSRRRRAGTRRSECMPGCSVWRSHCCSFV